MHRDRCTRQVASYFLAFEVTLTKLAAVLYDMVALVMVTMPAATMTAVTTVVLAFTVPAILIA
eukprot:1836538-Pleurochrysis_carterae.AAC.1